MMTLAFLPQIGPTEWLVILALGLLLFGKRLPEVGRSLGRGIVEFKRGLKGVQDEIDEVSDRPAPARSAAMPPRPLPAHESPAAPYQPVQPARSESRVDTDQA